MSASCCPFSALNLLLHIKFYVSSRTVSDGGGMGNQLAIHHLVSSNSTSSAANESKSKEREKRLSLRRHKHGIAVVPVTAVSGDQSNSTSTTSSKNHNGSCKTSNSQQSFSAQQSNCKSNDDSTRTVKTNQKPELTTLRSTSGNVSLVISAT